MHKSMRDGDFQAAAGQKKNSCQSIHRFKKADSFYFLAAAIVQNLKDSCSLIASSIA